MDPDEARWTGAANLGVLESLGDWHEPGQSDKEKPPPQCCRLKQGTLPGDGWRTRHDAINWSFSRFSTACQVPMTVEVYNLLCQHISQGGQRHFTGTQSRRNRQGKIPDGIIHLAPDVLYEVKTISASPTHYGHLGNLSAVDRREAKINGEYMATARAIDQKWNATPPGTQGPFETALRGFGDGADHCIHGHVIGMFGGISAGLTRSVRAVAQKGAENLFNRMGSSSMRHCQATLLWQARRDIGATIWAANADLILHRIQHLGGAASRERSRQRHAQYQFFKGGDPAAATFAHRNAAAGFDGQADYRRWRSN